MEVRGMFSQKETEQLWEFLAQKYLLRDQIGAESLGRQTAWIINEQNGEPAEREFHRYHLISVVQHIHPGETLPHRHDYVEFPFMLRGTSEHYLNGQKVTLHAGDVLFIAQDTMHAIAPVPDGNYLINFVIRPQFFDRVLEVMGAENDMLYQFFINCMLRKSGNTPAYLYFNMTGDRAVQSLMKSLIFTLVDYEYNQPLLQTTMGLLLQHLKNRPGSLQSGPSNDLVIWQVMQYIENQYAVANLKNLSQELGMDYHGLSRLIMQRTGKTFKQLLQDKRISRAEELLVNTELTAAAVGAAVGYTNMTYYYELFEKRYGVTPRELRINRKADRRQGEAEPKSAPKD